MPNPRRACLALVLPALAVFAAPAGAAIVPQDNIAGVKVGMSQERVLSILGSPRTTVTGRDGVTTYTYPRRGLKVLFRPNRANTKNVASAVTVYRHRKQLTAKGIGLRSTRQAVKRKVAGAKCRRYDPSYAICWVGKGTRGSLTTTFWLDRDDRVKLVTLARPSGD